MQNKWIDGFNKEVSEALSRLKAPKPLAVGPLDLSGASAAQGGPGAPGKLEVSRLELAVEDLRRRLEAQAARLEAETASRSDLQKRITALSAEVRDADERTGALRREASARAAQAKELEETVELAERARNKLSEVLKEERANAAHWRTQAQELKARLDSVWPALEKKEKELKETLVRYDEICRNIKEETGQRLKEVRLLTSETEKAKSRESELQARFDAQTKELEEERVRLRSEARRAMESAEAIRRDAVKTLEEARELRSGSPPSAAARDERRLALEAEVESLREEASRLRQAIEERSLAKEGKTRPDEGGGGARRVPWRYLFLAGFLAVSALSAWLAHNRARSHPVPFSHPTALVWQGDTLWASDWYDESVYKLKLENGKLELVRRFPLPGVHIAGMAAAGDVLYIVDSWSREIQRRRLDDALTLEASVRSPGTSPTALFFDGRSLWSADNSGALYHHAADATLTVQASYPGTTPPVAIEAEADRLWIAEGRTRTFFAHRRDSALTMEGAFGFKELDAAGAPLSCFARHGGKMWLGRDGSRFLLELPAGALSSRPVPHPQP